MERNKSLSLDMLFPISDVLGVSVQFLDTGIEEEYPLPTNAEYESLSPEIKIISMLGGLNSLGQQKAVERIEELTEISRYRRPDPAQPPAEASSAQDIPAAQDAPEGAEKAE